MAKIFISHSANADPVAAAVRDALAATLAAMGHVPLVDSKLVEPGDRWRAKLLGWLGSCQGAVILLTSAAANRDWVRAEATILGWRAWLNPTMRVVPVLLEEDASSSALDDLGLKPVQLRDIQVLKASDAGDRTPQSWAAAIAARFEGYKPGPAREDPMGRWLKDVTTHIQGNALLEEAAEALGIPEQDILDVTDVLANKVAYRILHSTATTIEQAFLELARDPRLPRTTFAPLISCAWFPADMASALFELAGRDETPRVAAVRLLLDGSPARLLRRLTCCDNRYIVVGPISPQGSEANDTEQLLGRYVTTILKSVGAESEAQLAASMASLDKARHKPVFVVLGAEALDTGVLPHLVARFEQLVFVCAGEQRTLDEHVLADASLAAVELTPRLDTAVELDGSAAAARIEVA